jgi:hypothetical protein
MKKNVGNLALLERRSSVGSGANEYLIERFRLAATFYARANDPYIHITPFREQASSRAGNPVTIRE